MTVIDDYLATLVEPAKSTLTAVCAELRRLLPGAEECISYNLPTFKVNGRPVAAFAAFKKHCSYFPHSGGVLVELPELAAKYEHTKSSLHFDLAKPLPKAAIAKLVKARQREIALTGR